MDYESNVIILDRGHYTTCAVNLYGATIVSWTINHQEQIFVSTQSAYDGKNIITGGISIVFPHYGKWFFGPKHGFAKMMRWKVEQEPVTLKSGDVQAVFSLTNDDFSQSMWNYPFKIIYTVLLLEKQLWQDLQIINIGKHFTYDFNILFNCCFKVPNIYHCEILGLQDCYYRDETIKNHPLKDFFEEKEAVIIDGWTKKCYKNTPQDLFITNTMKMHQMRIRKKNLPDAILWSPGYISPYKIKYYGDDDHTRYVCLKTGHVAERVILLPGEKYEALQKLRYIIPPNPKFDLEWPCPAHYWNPPED